MSKYTTEVRFICESISGEISSKGYKSIDEIINKAIPKVFDFAYPIFDENYRTVLEKKILKHFYTREIGEETYALWKLRLDTKLNEIMPYYNKLYESELLEFNPLYNINLTRVHDTQQTSIHSEHETNKNSNSENGNKELTKHNLNSNSKQNENNFNDNFSNVNANHSIDKTSSNGTKWDKYSDTPQGAVTNIDNDNYLTNARKNTDNTTTNNTNDNVNSSSGASNSKSTLNERTNSVDMGVEKVVNDNAINSEGSRSNIGNANSTENYLEKVVGYNSINPNKLLNDFRETFLNIDMLIINDLEPLFMQLW